MNIIKPETIEQLVKGAESLAKTSSGLANELVAEAINLFIVNSVLEILKFSVVFVVFFIVKKYVDSLLAIDEKNKTFKAMKTTALIVALVFFTVKSTPHLQDISKALVAPKIFLLEKSKELIGK